MALKEFAETSIRARAAFSDMICARRRGRGAAGPRQPRAAALRAPARRPPPAAGAAPRRATHTRPRIRRRPGRCRVGGRGRRAPRRRAPRRRATRCRSSPAPFSTTRAPPRRDARSWPRYFATYAEGWGSLLRVAGSCFTDVGTSGLETGTSSCRTGIERAPVALIACIGWCLGHFAVEWHLVRVQLRSWKGGSSVRFEEVSFGRSPTVPSRVLEVVEKVGKA